MWLFKVKDDRWEVALQLKPGATIKIGRAPHCDLVVNDTCVSKEQVVLSVFFDSVLLEKVSSLPNSLYINGSPCDRHKTTQCCNFSFGKHLFRVSFEPPPVVRGQSRKETTSALEFSAFLSSALQAETTVEALERILVGLVDLLEASCGYVLFKPPSEEKLYPIAKHKVEDIAEHLTYSHSVCEATMTNKCVVDIADPRKHPTYGRYSSVASMRDVQRIVCIPLLRKNKAVGAIYLEQKASKDLALKKEIGKELLNAISAFTSDLLDSKSSMDSLSLAYDQLLTYSDLCRQPNKFFKGAGEYGKELLEYIGAAAEQDTSVLLLGPTGCGKEMVAREIHRRSSRREHLFVPVNCAALARSVVEAELFGFEKGAFTGAYERRIGRFELANKGTLFLDEVGDIPLDVQITLLRVLQERMCCRVGGTKPIKLNFRLMCATNVNLTEKMREGSFRQDLYYRINVFPIVIKALQERADDIVPLANQFLSELSLTFGKRKKPLDGAAADMLRDYSWPGNIRELRNVIERAIITSNEETITAKSLGLSPQNSDFTSDSFWNDCPTSLEEACNHFERQIIVKVLSECEGSIAQAAEQFKVAKSTLYRKMHRLGIQSCSKS